MVTTIDATVELFRQTASGRFQPDASLPGLKSEGPVAFADLDLDGVSEVVISSSFSDGGIYLMRSSVDGGLVGPTLLTLTPGGAVAVLSLDVDGNGLDDLVLSSGSGQLFVMPNTCH